MTPEEVLRLTRTLEKRPTTKKNEQYEDDEQHDDDDDDRRAGGLAGPRDGRRRRMGSYIAQAGAAHASLALADAEHCLRCERALKQERLLLAVRAQLGEQAVQDEQRGLVREAREQRRAATCQAWHLPEGGGGEVRPPERGSVLALPVAQLDREARPQKGQRERAGGGGRGGLVALHSLAPWWRSR